MKKRTLTAVLALSMAFTVAFAAGCSDSSTGTGSNENQLHNNFINSIGGVSETYTGAISSNSYNSKEEAAEAYVTEEIAGDSNVNIVSTTSQQEYYGPAAVQNVITQQNLPIKDTSEIESIEKMQVEYTVDSASAYASPMAKASSSNKKVTVYVIKYTTHWEYYSPCPVTGSTITKSYYDSVFNSDAWGNCTYSMTLNMDMNVTATYQGQTQNMTVKLTWSQYAKYEEDKLYFEQSYSYSMNVPGYGSETESENLAVYMEETEEGTAVYVKGTETGMEWVEGELYQIGFSSLDELRPFASGYLDYTYFTKTDYGFELSSDNALQYLEETMGDELSSYLSEGLNVNMFCKYYVSNGVLSGMREDATMSMNMTQDGISMKMNATIDAESSVKDYGKTIVEKPFTEE